MEGNTTVGELNPIRYHGYYYDTETELYYLNSRYYDPEVCRFINADDAVFAITFDLINSNLFVYCKNMPISNVDKWGANAMAIITGMIIAKSAFMLALKNLLKSMWNIWLVIAELQTCASQNEMLCFMER